MRTTIFLVMGVLAGCVADERVPEDYGELDVSLAGESTAPFASYKVSVVDARSGKILLEQKIAIDPIVMPIDSRFSAALPASRPLLVDVTAIDAGGAAVGSGAAVAVLAPQQTTWLSIDVVARPGADPG